MIGTAGHVDHGKSTLIEALTGTHPDRLKEEQARQMTIDLGFGWLSMPDGREIGIVDVPGHRDFVENMLAGIAGIDAVLLVVAADEGIMAQTLEHLAIINLLQIHSGVIALTKIDLVSDVDELDIVENDIRAAVHGTVLEDAPIVRVSARTRVGVADLLEALGTQLDRRAARPDLGRPRLALDRVFTMEGFGTVVTGTLADGHLQVGDEVEVLPSGLHGRVRGLQNHRKQVNRVEPGSRTAVNLSGIAATQLRRGQVLTLPGQYEATRRVDGRMHLLPSASRQLIHNREVKVFIGTSQSIAAVRLLGADALNPGGEGWIQLELKEPVVCVRGDVMILRQPSPAETIGGAIVVDPRPAERHRRQDLAVIASLGVLAAGDPRDVVYESALAAGPAPLTDVVKKSNLDARVAMQAIHDLIGQGRLLRLDAESGVGDELVITATHLEELEAQISSLVADYHAQFPLRKGIPREMLKNQLGLAPKIFARLVASEVAAGLLVDRQSTLALPIHEVRFDMTTQAAIDQLFMRFEDDPHAPPSVRECRDAVGDEAFNALKELEELISVSPDVVFRTADYAAMVARIRDRLEVKGTITLAEVRDLLHTSRRYAQALLEHLDMIGLTRREGESRVLARPGAAGPQR